MQQKEALFGKTLEQLQKIVLEAGLPKFTAAQVCDWLYNKKCTSIEEMTNLSKNARSLLSEKYELGLSAPIQVQIAADGTKKYLFNSGSGFVEAAYIPEKARNTLCVSSQVGCKMRCLFCMTGKQGLQGNLTANQILNQVRSIAEHDQLTNVVYMGMGEPFDNLAEVMQSLEVLTAEWGYRWSPKRITVSTIGIVPAMKHFLENSNCHLAVSLHSPFESERRLLMPVSQKYTIENIIHEIKSHDLGRQRRISFEYIVFKGLNDSPKHVKELARILNGIRCRINLIRFHEIPNTQLETTDEKRLEAFKEELNAKGITTTIRASRGQDIDAACGLLSTREMSKKQDLKNLTLDI
ncbi:MAG: 23S rRNA (adenine(2503)-C(2))-methyltransferase RlmN [Bacteroidales bacterium]|jgi:23S rRNA (adenine2503-C2)-methyltransferase|nr:23S rRNA (adenine(2503)-C(2))-methyltransferase RlmN [Bacteroidales bacterium]